jgi:hypothetical protein
MNLGTVLGVNFCKPAGNQKLSEVHTRTVPKFTTFV